MGLGRERDDARLEAVRRTLEREPGGSEITIAADANGAFDPKEAVQHLRRWEKYGLGWIEQPVAAKDFDGLRFVRENAPTPVMADESAQGPREVLELVERRAVDLLHFKLCKAGGFAPLRTMMAVAEAAGIPYMVGQMDEGMLATAAAVHAGAASRGRYFEVDGNKRVTASPSRGSRPTAAPSSFRTDPAWGSRWTRPASRRSASSEDDDGHPGPGSRPSETPQCLTREPRRPSSEASRNPGVPAR